MKLIKSIYNRLSPSDSITENVHKIPNVVFVKALCKKNKKPILMKFQHEDPDLWLLTSSVPIKGDQVEKEVHVSRKISGAFDTHFGYRGCPYCNSWGYAMCRCGKLCCWDFKNGKPVSVLFKCPWCGKRGILNARISQMAGSRGS